MFTRVAGSIMLVLLLATVVFANLSPREVRTLMDEYVQAETSDERRGEIAEALRSAPARHTTSNLRRLLRNDDTRHLAIRLTGHIRHEQAWTLLRRYLDDEAHKESAVDALFLADTDELLLELAQRWRAAEPGSELERLLTERWKTSNHTYVTLDIIIKGLDDENEQRRSAARDILVAQTGLAPDADLEDLKQAATEHQRIVHILSSEFPPRGHCVFDELSLPHNAYVRRNAVHFTNGEIRFDGVADLQEQDHHITLFFYVVDAGEQTHLAYNTAGGAHMIDVSGTTASALRGEGDPLTTEINPETWNSLIFRVVDHPRQGRLVVAAINGERLTTWFSSGEITHVSVRTSGTLCIGGWQVEEQ